MAIPSEVQAALDLLTSYGWGIVGYNVKPEIQDYQGAVLLLTNAGYHIFPPSREWDEVVTRSLKVAKYGLDHGEGVVTSHDGIELS